MDTPPIQYAKTSDGVNIAYAVFGSGPAIVFASDIFGSVHLYRASAGVNRELDGLVSRGWSAITYDSRGTGSSDRNCDDYSLGAHVRDLEAVIERAVPGRFVLYGWAQGGPPAVAYTVQHPDRVTHLVLGHTYARGSEWYELIPAMRVTQETLSLVEPEWEFYLLGVANAISGYADSERARRLAEIFQAGINPNDYLAFVAATRKIDVRDLLQEVRVPTLVARRTVGFARILSAAGRGIAPLIPNARFVETDDTVKAIDEFLREGGLSPEPASETRSATAQAALPSGMTAILFADIVDSTALTERLGDAAFRAKARDLDGALRAVIREHAGTPIEGKLLGDGVLAVFTSARQAIEAALACARSGNEADLPLHLGLHAGDVIREDNNVYGGAVNIASRISGLSAPGEVLVSDIVRGLARTSSGVTFEDRGEHTLKGIAEPVRVYEVRWRD